MKKSIIAAGAASVALAAMPVLGVFADGEGSVTTTTVDTLTMNIPTGCNITTTTRSDTTAAFGTVQPGQTAEDGTTAIGISCNDAWKMTPAITTAFANTDSVTIASGATALDGSVSEWALKLAPSSDTGVTNAFSSYAAVDGTSVISGTKSSIASGLTITPTYKVSVAPGQANGNYTGEVTYTLALNS